MSIWDQLNDLDLDLPGDDHDNGTEWRVGLEEAKKIMEKRGINVSEEKLREVMRTLDASIQDALDTTDRAHEMIGLVDKGIISNPVLVTALGLVSRGDLHFEAFVKALLTTYIREYGIAMCLALAELERTGAITVHL